MYLGPLNEGIRSNEGLVQAKYTKLPLSPQRRSKVCLRELRKEANIESHANLGLNSREECHLKCPTYLNNSTKLRMPPFKLDQQKMIG